MQITMNALRLALEALEHSRPSMEHYSEAVARHSAAKAAVRAALAEMEPPTDPWAPAPAGLVDGDREDAAEVQAAQNRAYWNRETSHGER